MSFCYKHVLEKLSKVETWMSLTDSLLPRLRCGLTGVDTHSASSQPAFCLVSLGAHAATCACLCCPWRHCCPVRNPEDALLILLMDDLVSLWVVGSGFHVC